MRIASAGHGSAHPGKAEDIRLVVDTIRGWYGRLDLTVPLNSSISAGSNIPASLRNKRWVGGWTAAIHPDDLPRMLQTFHEALNLGRSFQVEGRFRCWDGEFRWFLFRGSPFLDASGKVVEWYGTNTDLEERKRPADGLRDNE